MISPFTKIGIRRLARSLNLLSLPKTLANLSEILSVFYPEVSISFSYDKMVETFADEMVTHGIFCVFMVFTD